MVVEGKLKEDSGGTSEEKTDEKRIDTIDEKFEGNFN